MIKICQLTCKYVCEIKGTQQFNRLKVRSTLGFPSKIQHTGSKHFKMGIYENTFWTLLTFETHSVIWAVPSWNSHCTMYWNYGLLMYTGSMMYFDRRVSAYVFFIIFRRIQQNTYHMHSIYKIISQMYSSGGCQRSWGSSSWQPLFQQWYSWGEAGCKF